MKRSALGVVILLLLLSMSGAAHAEGTRETAGLKTWVNTWRNEVPGVEDIRSNTVVLVGWEFEVDFANRVFVDASYLMSASDYRFDPAVMTAEVERTDVDVALGYQFNRTVGVFAGFRSTSLKDNLTERRETASGPLVGVRAAAPLSDALSLFGKLTMLPKTDKAAFSVSEERETASGWFTEAGITYAFTSRITVALGYKYEVTTGKDSRIKDTFAGSTFGVMYAFQ